MMTDTRTPRDLGHKPSPTRAERDTWRPLTVRPYVPTPAVAIVRHIGECDIAEIPGMRMPYPQALAELREIARVAPARLGEFDLVYVESNGALGRFASWQV